jgi:2-polyprenyl-3-methyl-5-hydroxy-6-metoxy-1,4-benzoquinol methylase
MKRKIDLLISHLCKFLIHRVPFIRDGLIAAGSVNNERLNTPTVLSDLQILDVGCGGGILSVPLARLGANVTGLDAGESVIGEIARFCHEYLKIQTPITSKF